VYEAYFNLVLCFVVVFSMLQFSCYGVLSVLACCYSVLVDYSSIFITCHMEIDCLLRYNHYAMSCCKFNTRVGLEHYIPNSKYELTQC